MLCRTCQTGRLDTEDHLARLVWEAVGYLDLTAFYAHIKVLEGGPGAAAIDPQIFGNAVVVCHQSGGDQCQTD